MSDRIWAAIITFIFGTIAITPYCGWLFDCGCTWPLLGLDANCNNHMPGALHKCPWCGNYVKGFISTVLTIGGATWLAYQLRFGGLKLRLFAGLWFFITTGFMTAWASASIQGYSHFII